MEENNHIIVNFQPFVAKQEILVYINGNCEIGRASCRERV